MHLSERGRAIFFMVLTSVLWSSSGLFIKLVTWNPFAISGVRSAIAALILWAYLRRPKMTWSFAQVGGAIAYAITVTLFVVANKLTTAANVTLLQYTSPIFIAIFGTWFLKEKPNKYDWVTIFIVFIGMYFFFLDELSFDNLLGNILSILSGVGFAWVALFMRKQKDESPLETAFLGNIFTFLINLPFMFGTPPDFNSILGLLFLGVFQLGFSYIFYAEAIKVITALESNLISVIEPLLNPIWVFFVIGEVPGKWAAIGGIIVLVSVTVRYTIFDSPRFQKRLSAKT
ncbi:MAG TPA: EamA family transporter [Thermoanaerobacterales bacterium]|nr:EamA family transporter [Thermoanaerobacterales bacterium]